MAQTHAVLNEEEPLSDYNDTFLECRGLSHLWRHVGYFLDGAYVNRMCVCTRCTCQKIQQTTRDGQLIGTKYQHPDDYLIQGSYIERQDVRREQIKRAGINGSMAHSAEELLQQMDTVKDRREMRDQRKAS